jgi:hypothetical protein
MKIKRLAVPLHRGHKVRPPTSEEVVRKALADLVNALSVLPKGHHGVGAVETWLAKDVGPAYKAARRALGWTT